MKKNHIVLGMLLSMIVSLSSCLGEGSSETILYDDAAITSFTLGTLTQYEPGTDEVVATITGSKYPMTIDQINGQIFNRTPLPVGTRINSVLCTIGTLNNGAVALQNLEDIYFNWFSASVGVDFSSDSARTFRVFASDGSFYRDYKVKVNVASTAGNNFSWGTAVADTALLRGFTDMRLVMLKNKRMVALCGNGTNTLVRYTDDNGSSWKEPETPTVLADSAWAGAVVKDSTLYLLSDGLLYSSQNGEQWNSSTADSELKQLVGASNGEIFALAKDSTLFGSSDNGTNWTVQAVEEGLSTDSVKQLFAIKDIAAVTFNYPASYHADYVLMVGNNGEKSVVWRKISHYDPVKSSDTWSNIPQESINNYLLPVIQHLSLISLDDTVLAFGNDATVYQSTDQGITWKTNETFSTASIGNALCVAVDSEGLPIAITSDGKVFRGIRY